MLKVRPKPWVTFRIVRSVMAASSLIQAVRIRTAKNTSVRSATSEPGSFDAESFRGSCSSTGREIVGAPHETSQTTQSKKKKSPPPPPKRGLTTLLKIDP